MALLTSLWVPIAFILGTFALTALNSAFRHLGKRESQNLLDELGKRFFYLQFQYFFFRSTKFKLTFFACLLTQSLVRFGYAISALAALVAWNHLPVPPLVWDSGLVQSFLVLLAFVIGSVVFLEVLPRVWGSKRPQSVLRLLAPITSLYLIACFPITGILIYLSLSMWKNLYMEQDREGGDQEMRQKIFDIIDEAHYDASIDSEHRRMIESAVSFRDRIVREVMQPRVDVFALAADTSIREAAHLMHREGFSRVPVYDGNLDNIIGILLYKEVLRVYMECVEKLSEEQLDEPVKTIITDVLFTPETRKISHMLQEFRRRQLHLAIVVDEYGGTEGVVSIEDLLEEIVGEIEDEYDTEEEELYRAESGGSWVVDARMGILDIEQKLGLQIPHDSNYDTLGGYIFDRAGTIPPKGMVLHHDDFDLEILSSDDRRVHKVRVTPLHEGVDEE